MLRSLAFVSSILILVSCGDDSTGSIPVTVVEEEESTTSTSNSKTYSGSTETKTTTTTNTSASASSTTTTPTTTSVANLAGTYSWYVGTQSVICTDGSSGTIASFAKNIDVTITNNIIKLGASAGDTSNTDAAAGGMTMTLSGYSGLIEKDGTFSAKQTGRGTHVTYGDVGLTYNIKGRITTAGSWSGDYEYKIAFEDLYETCTYTSKFSGTKQ